MKTAVSLPDDLFRLIDLYARRSRLSRSEVLARAAREYLARKESGEILDAINRACDRAPESESEKAARKKGKKAYARTLPREDW